MFGGCDKTGPCDWMRARVQDGTVRHYAAGLYLGAFRLKTCPWCHGRTTTPVVATWQWLLLQPTRKADPEVGG